MTPPELQAERRNLKSMLKKYDKDFYRKHDRMPNKSEKEPIRHLYDKYNTLKSQIEKFNSISCTATGTVSQQPLRPSKISHRISSFQSHCGSVDDSFNSSNTTETLGHNESIFNARNRISSKNNNSRLEELYAEKQNLYQMLRSNEQKFLQENNRPLSTYDDIKPVASQYRRYKEIKKTIAVLRKSGIYNSTGE